MTKEKFRATNVSYMISAYNNNNNNNNNYSTFSNIKPSILIANQFLFYYAKAELVSGLL